MRLAGSAQSLIVLLAVHKSCRPGVPRLVGWIPLCGWQVGTGVCNLVGDCVGECAAQLVSVQLGECELSQSFINYEFIIQFAQD